MKLTFTRSVLALSLIGLSITIFAQNKSSNTTQRFRKKSFLTFSTGLNAGMLTHHTPFNGPANGDFHTPEEKLGYGGYIKEQILPGLVSRRLSWRARLTAIARNIRLSKDRSEAVKAYLVSQGANVSRIEATRYGEDPPIASNKTASGRRQNSRVEFSLL